MPPQRLFERLPAIWKRYDRDTGFCEQFLDVCDDSFARAHGTVKSILDLRSVDRIPDRYLALVSDQVGHVWRSGKSYDWNRSRIRDAIRRHSYKGSRESLADLIREYGGTQWSVVDMASRVIVLDKQSTLDDPNCRFECADYWHQGAYVLTVDDGIDLEGFLPDFAEIKPAGTRWTIYLNTAVATACETVGYFQVPTSAFMTNTLDYAIDCGGTFDEDLYLGAPHIGQFQFPVHIQAAAVFGAQTDLADPMVLLSDTDVYLNSGTPENPLPDAVAGRRAVFEIS